MVKIKGWEKQTKDPHSFYYATNDGMVEILINQEVDIIGKTKDGRYKYGTNHGIWYVAITRKGKKWFRNKYEAIKYAKKYMRSNPNGKNKRLEKNWKCNIS